MDTMRQFLVTAVFGTIVPAAVTAQAGPDGRQLIPEVRSHGTATVTVNADLALVTIQYSANARTPAAASVRRMSWGRGRGEAVAIFLSYHILSATRASSDIRL